MSLGYYQSLMNNQTSPFSNAASSYAFRVAKPGYSGSLFRAYRVSDSAEQDIGISDPVTDLETFASGGEVRMTTWYNQSGGSDLSISTASLMPRLTDGSGNAYTTNGIIKARFLGGQEMDRGGAFISDTFSYAFSMETNSSISSGFNVVMSQGATTSIDVGLAFIYRGSGGNRTAWRCIGATTAGNVAITDTLSTSTRYVVESYGDGSTQSVYLNDTSEGTNSYSGSVDGGDNFTIGNLSSGSSLYFVGYINEIHTWADSELSNRAEIYSGINDNY